MNIRLKLAALAGTLLALAIPAHAEFIYIADTNGKVVVYDDQTDTISAVGNVSDSHQVSQDIGIAWDSTTGRILLLDRGTPTVFAMNPADGTSVPLFSPGEQFQGGAVKGTTLYGIDEILQDMVAYDLTTFNAVVLGGTTDLQSHSHGVGIDAATGQLYASGNDVFEIADDGSTTATLFASPIGFIEDIDFYGGNFLAVSCGSEVYSIDGSGVSSVFLDSTRLDPFGLNGCITGVVLAADGQGEIPSTARFNVTKTFTDGSTDSVDVTLTCNAGLPLVQNFTIDGGDPDGVTFVVNNIPQSGADCTVTESGGPDGYTPVMNGGAGCSWDNVLNGNYACAIENQADPATYTVDMVWMVGEGGVEESDDVDVTITCDSEILTVNGAPTIGSPTSVEVTLGDGDSLVVTVDTANQAGEATCSASQDITQSGVESSAEGCGDTVLSPASSETCTFTNTVFFEGIPTLSQLGMVIMALLMLSVGLVGFRRFA